MSDEREIMDCYSPPGTRVVFAYPTAGWPGEGEAALKVLKLNGVYTVQHTVIGGSYSKTSFREVPGYYNTVLFRALPDIKSAAVKTLENLGYTYTDGAELWKPPLGEDYTDLLERANKWVESLDAAGPRYTVQRALIAELRDRLVRRK